MRADDVFAVFPETITMPAGTTIAINPIQGQLGIIMKYVSGGSLSIYGATYNTDILGATYTTAGASYSTALLYTLGTSEILNIALSGKVNVLATGATLVFQVMRLRSQGY